MFEDFLIVGFDPGNTVGVSIISFDGSVKKVFSYRNVSLSKVIVDILDFGFPIIVSTDKKVVPKKVRFLSSKLNLKIVNPNFDLNFGFKKKIINNFFNSFDKKVKFSNSHEFDSFSAAVFAFNKFKSLFLKIERHLKDIRKEDVFSFLLEVFSGKNIVSVKNSFLELYSFEDNFEDNNVKNFYYKKDEKKDENFNNNVKVESFDVEEFNILKSKFDFVLKENFFLKRRVYFNNKKLFYFKSLVNILSKDVKYYLKNENKVFNKIYFLEEKIKDFEFDKKIFFKNLNFFDGFVFENNVFFKQKFDEFDEKIKVDFKKYVSSFKSNFFVLKEKSKNDIYKNKSYNEKNNVKEDFEVKKSEFEEFIKNYKLFRKKYLKK